MLLSNVFVGFLKKPITFLAIVTIAVPIRYGSVDHQHLQLRLLHSILSKIHSFISDSARPTLSAEYRAFENIVRMKPIEEHDLLADPIITIRKFRSLFIMDKIIPKPSQCQINKEIFEHDGHLVDTYWIDNPTRKFQTNSDKLLIYLHGGAYLAGDVYSYSGIECHLSELFNMSILHVEYRLSPEHSFPAAVDDTIALYRALLRKNFSPSQLLLMGDSAGGGLALLTVQALIANRLPLPHGVIIISPWADVSTSGESYTRNEKVDVMLTTDSVKWAASQLVDANRSQLSLHDASVSPLFGSFEGFPPMYVTVGTAELLEDDSRGIVKKAQEAGVDVTFEEGLHLMHVYPLFFPYFPEARNTLDNINKWIQTIFN